ncbi:phytanoyl-CoA dioxygenase family protein [Sphingomonas sp. NSE70-1]|uniref:Phytanoyl-CoA dioxygenase family protein n=1 Tax=Sphingomonas caseinilyticus TaxID=2908205 RepID=A0ABT0RQJ6_9SPHN|nr:phytanoyl-CoA dioxygenase family protein [Sphingomonas caseinilyticus]MCL6697292.1 phytanoyl-CoA dioxygenase family protein [Sphingomonas caseinilyticus]
MDRILVGGKQPSKKSARGKLQLDQSSFRESGNTAVAATPVSVQRRQNKLRWWRLPFWVLAVVSGAKSFVDNPIIGSKRLNRVGLHLWRIKAAHRLAAYRRAKLARLIPADFRQQFDRDGFVEVPNFLPEDVFRRLQAELLECKLESRIHQQGDTVTRRVPVGPEFLAAMPDLDRMLDSPLWKGIMAYVASSRTAPLYYIQTIIGGCVEAPPDPQIQLHADTFHPSMKAWLFLTDVGPDDRPLTYVAGSHRLTPERAEWEYRKSIDVAEHGDRLSQRGSFRITPEELGELNLPNPTHFAVPANTLIAADTCGFHARANSNRVTVRVELWAYARRTPYIPWTGLDPLSWRPIAIRRAEWLASIIDWLSRRGWKVQHWRPAGLRRPVDA